MHDPVFKKILRLAWSAWLTVHALINAVAFFRPRKEIRVFYGGARPGDVGGPLVKVKRLHSLFAERLWFFNIVYVLSNTPYLPDVSLLLLRLRKIPMVHNQNGVFYPAWYEGDWQAQNRRMARTFHQADYVFFQSEFCKQSAERYLGTRVGKGEVLYNAVDTKCFCPPSHAPLPQTRAYRFLLTGKIGDHLFYRIESSMRGLAEAVKLGLDAELYISGWLGEGVAQKTAQLVSELNLEGRVRVTGPYTQEQAPQIYREADAYIMMKHNDPCPNTVLEALATGLPVLYSDSGGVGELVGDAGIGLPCQQSWEQPFTPEVQSIARGMRDLAEKHDVLSVNARNRAVERFDIRHWERRHSEVFEELVAKGRS